MGARFTSPVDLSAIAILQRTLTVWLISSFTSLDSTASLHTKNNIFSYLVMSTLVKLETSCTVRFSGYWVQTPTERNSYTLVGVTYIDIIFLIELAHKRLLNFPQLSTRSRWKIKVFKWKRLSFDCHENRKILVWGRSFSGKRHCSLFQPTVMNCWLATDETNIF